MKDVSVYDPYWSVAPPVLLLSVMIKYGLWNVNSVILFSVVLIWSARLTLNWFITYKGVGREDWRYAQYREKYPPFVFQLISFVGLQFVPTAVVYAGLTGVLFSIQKTEFSALSLFGVIISLCAVGLEFVSDRAIHGFLREHKGENRTCDVSVWKYSRHPNYLGEMSFWCGLYLYFAALCPEIWYAGLGVLSIIILFLSVSVPMMERHNEKRRPDYAEYKARTSAVLILPNKRR
jgi:steroid 5-alpha reductase family enzyme